MLVVNINCMNLGIESFIMRKKNIVEAKVKSKFIKATSTMRMTLTMVICFAFADKKKRLNRIERNNE